MWVDSMEFAEFVLSNAQRRIKQLEERIQEKRELERKEGEFA